MFLVSEEPEDNQTEDLQSPNQEESAVESKLEKEEANSFYPLTPLSKTAARILSCITSPFLDTSRKRTFSENSSSCETDIKRFKPTTTSSSSSTKVNSNLIVRFPFNESMKRKTVSTDRNRCSSSSSDISLDANDHHCTEMPAKNGTQRQEPPVVKRILKDSTLTEYYSALNGEARLVRESNMNKTSSCPRSSRRTYNKAIRNNHKISDWLQKADQKNTPASLVCCSTPGHSNGIPPIRTLIDVENNTIAKSKFTDVKKSPISPLLSSLSAVLRENNNQITPGTVPPKSPSLHDEQEGEEAKDVNPENTRTPPRPPGIPKFVSTFQGHHHSSPDLPLV